MATAAAPATSMVGTTTSSSVTPTWYDELAGQFGNTASGALSNVANLGNQWFDQPLVAGLTPQQQNVIGQAPATAGQWQPGFQGGLSQVQSASNWDPSQLQQHLNPYLPGVLDEIARRGNQNLTEKIMPSVNRTFTGSGLFGSSGNAEFLNRAIRDTQGEILGQQATTGLSAYNQAAQDYLNWGKLGTEGGQTQMTGSIQGQGQRWDDLTKQYGMEEQQRQNTQQGLTASYEDWLKQLTTPYSLLGGLSQAAGNFMGPYKGASTVINTPNATTSNSLQDLMAIISAVGTGANANV